jgi:hypothetical protein
MCHGRKVTSDATRRDESDDTKSLGVALFVDTTENSKHKNDALFKRRLYGNRWSQAE